MDDEVILTGYCRCLDQSRMVTVEIENGSIYADCSFGNCPYQTGCAIAEKIQQLET